MLDDSINETTEAAKTALEKAHHSGSLVDWHIMNCVYAYLIIRTSSFYDELTTQFLRTKGLKKSKDLVGAIAHFRKLYKLYNLRDFCNFLAHNRKVIYQKPKGRKYKPISDADIVKISKLKSHIEFSSFGVATNRIIKFIEEL